MFFQIKIKKILKKKKIFKMIKKKTFKKIKKKTFKKIKKKNKYVKIEP
jgi:hypothetical protein